MKRLAVCAGVFSSLLVASGSASAEDHYVRAGATGTNTGADWTNAYGSLPTALLRGDTYYIAAGSYGSYSFDDDPSGSTRIIVKHATPADHGTDAGWSDAYAGQTVFEGDLTCRTGFLTLDGVTGGGPSSWEDGFGIRVQTTSKALLITSGVCDNLVVRHVDFAGSGRLAPRAGDGGTDVDLIYIAGGTATNLTFQYSLLRDANRTHMLSWAGDVDGLTFEYSKMARNGPWEHAECWSAGTDKNVVVRYSWLEDCMATGFIAIVNGNGTAANWQIYGNIFSYSGLYTDGFVNTGVIMNRYDPGGSPIGVIASNWKIYNNVFANIGNGSYSAAIAPENAIDYEVKNNIWYANSADRTGAFDTATSDFNWFYGNDSDDPSGPNDIVGSGNPFVSSQPWATGDWSLREALPGEDLGPPFDKDYMGSTRGADGVWDRGALEFGVGPGGPSPAPPANVRVR